MTDYKEKYQEARKTISEQKKVIKKQEKFIEKLCLKLAEKNKKALFHDKQSLKHALQELKELKSEVLRQKTILQEKDEAIFRLTNAIHRMPLSDTQSKTIVLEKAEPFIRPAASDTATNYLPSRLATMLNCGVDRLYLRKKDTDALFDGGIETIYQLVTTPRQELEHLPGLTVYGLKKIADKLKAQNLSLEMKIQYLPDIDKYIRLS
jgi:hypothetical protein